MLKIGYFADGLWAHEAFKLLIADNNIEIKFICVRFDTNDDVLKGFAHSHTIDYIRHKNVNSKEFIDTVKKYDCDLFVSMSFDQIFREEIINTPRLKTINCHAGKLPFYRGRNILNWALINDEKEFGITVHYVDTGIDTGDIVLQKTYPITDLDDYKTLLARAVDGCALILYQAVRLFVDNNVKPIKQSDIHPVGFYCSQRKEGDEIINWKQTSREAFNFIRALCKPGPMARSSTNGKEIKLNKSRIINLAPSYKNTIGSVVGITNAGFIVKTLDSTLEITEYEYDGKMRIGDRLK
jgi:methionyl-tRNA formyltransferase